MKKIIEIFDISDDYQDYIGNPYVVVINQLYGVDKKNFKNILDSHYTVLTINEWLQYKSIIADFNNNDAKHRMRKEQPLEYAESNRWKRIYDDGIASSDNSHVAKAINMLSPQPKSRFIKYYIDGKTYQEIALEEGRHISTIYESIKGAKKKFLKYLRIFENTPEK